MHPAVTPMIERAAYLGGCDMVAVDLAVERLGIPATGTTPHALVLILGSTGSVGNFNHVTIKPTGTPPPPCDSLLRQTARRTPMSKGNRC
jgi:hypothetical protein